MFGSTRLDRLKLLYWAGSGLVMAYKRLEDSTFVWPVIRDATIRLNHARFEALFSGLDWRCQRRNKIRPLGGAKTGHFGSGRNARPEAAASQPRFPNSWRLSGRFGPSGPNQRGSAQAVSVDLRARL